MPDIPEEVIRPIIFVHGLAGSASQYQTQAMRFASNGYPDDRIVAFEYSTDGLAAVTRAATGGLNETLDQFVDTQRERFESDQVYLVCHSLGTRVCSQYLSDPERAMKVAKYIAIDGIPGDSCPGDVPCMGVFVSPENTLGGNNLHLPSEAHVQVATSEASFAGQFRFLTGVDPERTQILPQEGRVKISGRVVYSPANEGGGWNGIEHLASKSGNGGQGRGQASCYVYDRQQRQLGAGRAEPAGPLRAAFDSSRTCRTPFLPPALSAQQQLGALEHVTGRFRDRAEYACRSQSCDADHHPGYGVVRGSPQRAERHSRDQRQ